MIQAEKKALRSKMKTLLAAMGEDDRRARSAGVQSWLTGLDVYKESRTILAYASFGSEVQTQTLIERILQDGKTLVLPRLKPAGHSLALHDVKNLDTDLVKSKFGILEPRPTLLNVALRDIALILVPGLAFDPYGNRLGRGLGCYDRLLADATPANVTAAMAFEAQIVGGMDIPEDEYDVPMDMIVTESRVIDRRDVFELLKRKESQKSRT